MAIEYHFLLASPERPSDPDSSKFVFVNMRELDEQSREIHLSNHSIDARWIVLLRLNKFHLREAEQDLGFIVLNIAEEVSGDLLLLGNGELPVLRRSAGRLILSTRSSIWKESCRKSIHLSYEMADLGPAT